MLWLCWHGGCGQYNFRRRAPLGRAEEYLTLLDAPTGRLPNLATVPPEVELEGREAAVRRREEELARQEGLLAASSQALQQVDLGWPARCAPQVAKRRTSAAKCLRQKHESISEH